MVVINSHSYMIYFGFSFLVDTFCYNHIWYKPNVAVITSFDKYYRLSLFDYNFLMDKLIKFSLSLYGRWNILIKKNCGCTFMYLSVDIKMYEIKSLLPLFFNKYIRSRELSSLRYMKLNNVCTLEEVKNKK